MAQLIVRDLDAEVVLRLKMRAAAHRRSAEAEHRAILEHALLDRHGSLKDQLCAIPDVGTAHDFRRSRSRGRPVDL